VGINFTVNAVSVGEYGILNKIDKGKINSDILVSGSSRALKAINPEIISNITDLSCYNIASDGSDLAVQITKLKWYLTNNKKPKIIIQDISQFGGAISKTIFEPFKYIPYLSNDSLFSGLLRIDEDLWYNKYFPPSNLVYYNFIFYSKLLEDIFATINRKDKFINGYLPDNSKWSSDFNAYRKTQPNGINCSLTVEYKDYLEELIELCKKENICLIFVVLPNYYKLKEISNNQDKVLNTYSSLADSGNNIFFYDFSSNYIARDTNYLYNFTHLNTYGANLFSKILADSSLTIHDKIQ
jgi:hypothetical protein